MSLRYFSIALLIRTKTRISVYIATKRIKVPYWLIPYLRAVRSSKTMLSLPMLCSITLTLTIMRFDDDDKFFVVFGTIGVSSAIGADSWDTALCSDSYVASICVSISDVVVVVVIVVVVAEEVVGVAVVVNGCTFVVVAVVVFSCAAACAAASCWIFNKDSIKLSSSLFVRVLWGEYSLG